MPWRVERSDSCPADEPWAVINTETNEKVACHPSEEAATRHQRALYANVPEARSAQFFDALADVPNFRSSRFDDVEMVETAKGFKFDGVAAPTGIIADLGDFTEEYERGAFRKFLAGTKDNIPFLHEHEPRDLLATTRSGRLHLSEDGRGLRAKADIIKTDLSERIKALVDSGDIGGMSVGMIVGRGNAEVRHGGDGRPHRSIRAFKKLLDVCTTFDPAYVTTEAQFRSNAMRFVDSPESWQRLLMGAYPQLVELGHEHTDRQDELEETRTADPLAGEESATGVAAGTSVAARKRALQFLVLTTGGIDETR